MNRSIYPLLLLSALLFALPACAEQHDEPELEAGVPAYSHGPFGIGQLASDSEIAGWDIDIRPDGKGLPPGSGNVEDGEMLYESGCASCHGSFGEGVGRYPVLAGGQGTLAELRPERTVGSFWPYASTLWDYINRAMPFTAPQSLSVDEVYAITAYVLYLNDLVDDDFELSAANLASIEMPNQEGFFIDDRPDTDNPLCMENCRDPDAIEITSEPQLSNEETDTPLTDGTAQQETNAGLAVYQQACQVCHAAGVAGAPKTGDAAAWSERMLQGRDVLLNSVLQGKGAMPPKGGFVLLEDQDVINALDYMIGQVKPGASIE